MTVLFCTFIAYGISISLIVYYGTLYSFRKNIGKDDHYQKREVMVSCDDDINGICKVKIPIYIRGCKNAVMIVNITEMIWDPTTNIDEVCKGRSIEFDFEHRGCIILVTTNGMYAFNSNSLTARTISRNILRNDYFDLVKFHIAVCHSVRNYDLPIKEREKLINGRI